MTEAEKEIAEQVAAQKAADGADAAGDGTGQDDQTGADGDTAADGKPDYEALLAEERERANKAERAAAKEAFKRREAAGDEEEDEKGDASQEDKPLTAKELTQILAKDRERNRKEAQVATIADKARNMSSSEAEAQLIIELHKNRSWPDSLSLDEQLEEAQAIANRKKVAATTSELKRALRSKETANDSAAGTHRESSQVGEPKQTADIIAVKQQGMGWDTKRRVYTKKIGNGKRVFYYDPKTSKRWTETA